MTDTSIAELPPLATVAALADWTGRPSDDPALARALASASARFRAAVRHPVSHVTGDEITLDGTGSPLLVLPAAPVTAVATVAVDGTAVSDYHWSRSGMVQRSGGQCWPHRLGAVRVVYDHGYDPVPSEVAEAVVQQARLVLALDPGVASMTVGDEVVTYASLQRTELPDAWNRAVSLFALNQGEQA